jgi:hypothetical protein
MEMSSVQANSGIFNKLRGAITGRDYYKTSTGVKIVTDKNHGKIYEDANGVVIAEGLQNADIKGTRNADDITVSSSTVAKLDSKKGDDVIKIDNSNLDEIYGGRGRDLIHINNSVVNYVHGGCGNDTIIANTSKIRKIDGEHGNDKIETSGGCVDEVEEGSFLRRDNISICNNPINPEPLDETIVKQAS